MFEFPDSPAAVSAALSDHNYLTDEGLSTVVYLAMTMERPLFLEGDAGVGKTELAKVLAAWTGGELIRLQCYEGIDASQALYEWDYTRQLLHLRTAEAFRQSGCRCPGPPALLRNPRTCSIHAEGNGLAGYASVFN